MRTLIILIVGVFVLAAIVVSNRIAARQERDGQMPPDEGEPSLALRLRDAAGTFGAAAESLGNERVVLRTALSDLSSQCAALGERAGGAGFSRRAHASVTRLLLALYAVVERVTVVAGRGASEATDALLDSAVAPIVEATDSLHAIADRADEAMLLHLEADLDVLRERLDRDG